MNAILVDLRSDTVTKPSAAMRRAMADAEVGDDWFGDDPTVNRLQERAAEAVSKEAACYVPTGTMANQIALRLHFRGTGHLVLAEASAHVSTTEVVSSAALSGMSFRGCAATAAARSRSSRSGPAWRRTPRTSRSWTSSQSRTRTATPAAA